MGQCNHCMLERLKKKVQRNEEGMIVTVIKPNVLEPWCLEACDAYVHPVEIDIKDLSDEEREVYQRIWFMELPDHCTC